MFNLLIHAQGPAPCLGSVCREQLGFGRGGESTARILHHQSYWDTWQTPDKRFSGEGKRLKLMEPLIPGLSAEHWTSVHPLQCLHPTAAGHGAGMCCQRNLEGNQKPACCRHTAHAGECCSLSWDPRDAPLELPLPSHLPAWA